MRRYYIVSEILSILFIINFAVAAPAPVREKGLDVVHIPEDAITMLDKRGGGEFEPWLKLLEGHFEKKVESSVARPSSSSPPSGTDHEWTDVEQFLPSNPGEPSPVSKVGQDHAPPSPGSLTESGYELIEGDAQPGPSSPDHELTGAHALPNSGRPTEPGHDLTEGHAPLSSPVLSTWFDPDHGLTGAATHPPMPYLGPSFFKQPSTESDRLVVEEPPSRPASPREFDAD